MKTNCKKYLIRAKHDYEIIVDPTLLIISCNPVSENLLYKDFKVIFDTYKKKVKFDYLGECEAPLVVEEEILEIFQKKNPKINYLIDKFNLTI